MALYWCSLIVLAWIGARDWKQRRITNASLIILAALGLACATTWVGPTWKQVGLNLLIGLAITVPGYARGVVGGGDVKLMVAVSALWPTLTLLLIFAVGTLTTVVLMKTFQHLREHGNLGSHTPATQPSHSGDSSPPPCSSASQQRGVPGLPLGTAMALGALLVHVGAGDFISLPVSF